jgi:hypothetical protein
VTHPDQDAYTQQLEKRIADLEDLVYKWKNLGAQNLFGGHGFAKIGASFLFLGEGLQVLAPTESTAITWLPAFDPLFDPTTDFPNAQMDGQAESDDGEAALSLYARSATVRETRVVLTSDVDGGVVNIRAQGSALIDAVLAVVALAAGDRYVSIQDVPLWLAQLPSDPAVLADGEVWYRTDTDKFRGRANGATDNFAMEGWVDAAYVGLSDADWIDLTDGGATTLHTHAGGSGHTIRENGTDQTARTGLNFIDVAAGAGLITDDAGGDETEVHLDLYLLRADANWVDLTDGGATTLHTHAGGSGVSIGLAIELNTGYGEF